MSLFEVIIRFCISNKWSCVTLYYFLTKFLLSSVLITHKKVYSHFSWNTQLCHLMLHSSNLGLCCVWCFQVVPLHIKTASVFYGQIVQKEDGSFQSMASEMTSYYAEKKSGATELLEGGLYAVQENELFHRYGMKPKCNLITLQELCWCETRCSHDAWSSNAVCVMRSSVSEAEQPSDSYFMLSSRQLRTLKLPTSN